MQKVAPYILVVLVSWVGGFVAADQAVNGVEALVQKAREDRYQADLAGCQRGIATVRLPLQAFATAVENEDDVGGDLHRAARNLSAAVAPVPCTDVIAKP